MKQKKLLSTLLCTLAAAVCTAVPAYADDSGNTVSDHSYDGVAKELYNIGILRGDGTSFNLEQVPDRIQACVMVVRMRGEEEAALAAYEAGEITCPFTDITDAQEWAKPYLAWLYEKKITLGTGDGKFGNAVCTPQMYTTFMLRALGYVDTGDTGTVLDFTFADALAFAEEKALWDDTLAAEDFTRGIMAAVTYQTLAADTKATDFSLLETLVLSGAVDANAAQPILLKADALDEARGILAELSAGTTSCEKTLVTARTEMNIVSTGIVTDDVITETIVLNTETACDGTGAAMTGTLTLDGEDWGTMGIWYKDGTVYTELFDEKTKAAGSISDVLLFDLSGVTVPAYYAVDAVSGSDGVSVVRTADGGMVLTCAVSDWLLPMMENVFGADAGMYGTEVSRSCDNEMTITFAADGMVTSVRFTGILLHVWDFGEQGKYTQQYTLYCDLTLSATGDDVIVTYPDLTGFAG
ncbi:MAG: S-layer homology domain-containing protein [Clostridia bacterium]|nr:S-layer homology domain-containing protein [Clostridia bacterium]